MQLCLSTGQAASTSGSASCPKGVSESAKCFWMTRSGSSDCRTQLRNYACRFADDEDDDLYADYDAGYVSPTDGYIPRPATTRKHTDAQGRLTIDRGTQTISRVRPVTDPSAYRVHKPEFFTVTAVNDEQVQLCQAGLL